MNFDTNGMGTRSSLSLTAGITAMSAFNSLPEPVRVMIGVLALAFANFAIEWFRFKRAELAQKREQIETARESVPPGPPGSAPGFARIRALLLLSALFLGACGGRFFLRVFSEPTLGKCVASGYQYESTGPEFTSYSGGLQCVSSTLGDFAAELPLPRDESDAMFLNDAHEENTD